MKFILLDAWDVFNGYSGWIIWNLFLAFIPLVLSYWLFKRRMKKRSLFWWLNFIIFIAFLPNAAYLLTDVIHSIEAIRGGYSIWITTLIIIPLHFVAILAGWEAYVIAIMNQSHYLKKQGGQHWIFASELITHILCAIGIFMGRFHRFNSWDLITKPHILFLSTVEDFTDQKTVLIMLITFVILTILYWFSKQITLGTILRIKQVLFNFQLRKESY